MAIKSTQKINWYEQATEPVLDLYERYAFWKDTNDNKVYLVCRRGAGDQVSVELA